MMTIAPAIPSPMRDHAKAPPLDSNDLRPGHDEHVVGDRDGDGRDAEDGARADGDEAADEESGDGCLGHDGFLSGVEFGWMAGNGPVRR
jgi:hypothetical protein